MAGVDEIRPHLEGDHAKAPPRQGGHQGQGQVELVEAGDAPVFGTLFAEVDDAEHEARGVGQHGGGGPAADLPHRHDVDAVFLLADAEGDAAGEARHRLVVLHREHRLEQRVDPAREPVGEAALDIPVDKLPPAALAADIDPAYATAANAARAAGVEAAAAASVLGTAAGGGLSARTLLEGLAPLGLDLFEVLRKVAHDVGRSDCWRERALGGLTEG